MFFYTVLGEYSQSRFGCDYFDGCDWTDQCTGCKGGYAPPSFREIPVYLITLVLTLFVGIKEGLIIGVIVNLLMKRGVNFSDADPSQGVE